MKQQEATRTNLRKNQRSSSASTQASAAWTQVHMEFLDLQEVQEMLLIRQKHHRLSHQEAGVCTASAQSK